MMKVNCDTCKKDFLLTAVKDIKVDISGKTVALEYFICPHCKQVHKVCIKDHGYDVLKKELNYEIARYNKLLSDPKKYSVSDMEKRLRIVEKKKKNLARHVDVTNIRYPGTFTLVASENNNEDKIVYQE